MATSRTGSVLDGGSNPIAALNDGFQAAFLGGVAIAALGFVLTLLLISNSDSRAHVELGRAAAGEDVDQEATEPASA